MFLRVDDRLIHGQVVTAWIKELNVKQILVIDDIAANNTIIAKALSMATPKNVKLTIMNVADAAAALGEFPEADLLIIVKSVITARRVIDNNIDLKWTVNVGNIGMDAGRKKYAQTVHLDEENYQAVSLLKEQDNVDIFMQTVPGQPINQF